MGRKSAGKMAPMGRQKSSMLKQNSTDSQQVSRNSDHTVIINIHSNFHYSKRLPFELYSLSALRESAQKKRKCPLLYSICLDIKMDIFLIYSC